MSHFMRRGKDEPRGGKASAPHKPTDSGGPLGRLGRRGDGLAFLWMLVIALCAAKLKERPAQCTATTFDGGIFSMD